MKENLVEQFEQDGWALVPAVINREQIQDLRRLLQADLEKTKQSVLFDVLLNYPDVLALFCNERLVDALTQLLGKHFLAVPHSSVMKNSFGYFHADSTSAEVDGQTFHQDRGFRMVTVGIYLQDNDEHGGGIRFVPGSHKGPDEFVELLKRKEAARAALMANPIKRFFHRVSRGRLFDYQKPFKQRPNEFNVPSKAGDAVIWDYRLAHSACHPSVKGPVPYGDKLVVIFTCGRDNGSTEQYFKYTTGLPQNDYLRKPRVIPERVKEAGAARGFGLR
jgi:hypothetical protein